MRAPVRAVVVLLLGVAAAPTPAAAQKIESQERLDAVDKLALQPLAGGAPLKFGTVRKPVTLVALWTSSCPPCWKELAFLDQLAARYAGDDTVAVVAVAFDPSGKNSPRERDRARKKAVELKVKLPLYWDARMSSLSLLGPTEFKLPLLAVLDAKGALWNEAGLNPPGAKAYVAAKAALVEKAKKGELPVDSAKPAP